MKTYIGTKVIRATPMTRLAYNQLRGWTLPADENGDDEGYLVEYTDGGRPNVEGYIGYVSWSPKAQFEGAYKEVKTVKRASICMSRAEDAEFPARCHPSMLNCNGFCKDASIKSPMSYEIPLFDFGRAIQALKAGNRVTREGWNGKGMWLSLSGVANIAKDVPAEAFWSPHNAAYAAKQPERVAKVLPCITMKTATGEILMGWLASQSDMLAEDWMVLE